jgi:hypothetical protein
MFELRPNFGNCMSRARSFSPSINSIRPTIKGLAKSLPLFLVCLMGSHAQEAAKRRN